MSQRIKEKKGIELKECGINCAIFREYVREKREITNVCNHCKNSKVFKMIKYDNYSSVVDNDFCDVAIETREKYKDPGLKPDFYNGKCDGFFDAGVVGTYIKCVGCKWLRGDEE